MVPRVKQDFPAHCVTRTALQVRFCETDLMGVVHHGSYLPYFELGRIDYLKRRGLSYSECVARGVHLPVVESWVRHRKPAYFDDALTIETRLTQLSRVQVGFGYRIVREAVENQELIAEGNSLLACVGDNHALRRLPPETVEILLRPELPASGGSAQK